MTSSLPRDGPTTSLASQYEYSYNLTHESRLLRRHCAQRSGAFRLIYAAKFDDAVYVLHAFQKKTRETAKADRDLAARRYKLLEEKS